MSRDSDIQMLKYFWREKRDPTRFTGWERIVRNNEYPEIVQAWRNLQFAELALDALIDRLEGDDE